eukprot:5783494-Prymnesium_polylepis.4
MPLNAELGRMRQWAKKIKAVTMARCLHRTPPTQRLYAPMAITTASPRTGKARTVVCIPEFSLFRCAATTSRHETSTKQLSVFEKRPILRQIRKERIPEQLRVATRNVGCRPSVTAARSTSSRKKNPNAATVTVYALWKARTLYSRSSAGSSKRSVSQCMLGEAAGSAASAAAGAAAARSPTRGGVVYRLK